METDSTCPSSICIYRNRVTGHCTYNGTCELIYATIEKEETKMPEGLTKTGYDLIIDKIINRTVQPPNGKTAYELTAWLTGYADCQRAVVDIINKLKDQYGR